MAVKPVSTPKAAKRVFKIDCSLPLGDSIFDMDNFQQYIASRIKVNGKTANLGEDIVVEADGDFLNVTTTIAFSKRYLKYLTKKFLKKNNFRDYMRVSATGSYTYTIKYFDLEGGDEEFEGEEEEN
ncbi:hypothetical protein H696_02773 [Fonticula alba]|uniref:Large ribosomal subunit protein eL22 n=1 Tax=Fonticula alba TaxID=691883 RepID=A0A058Z8J8_FONAL|nr:hypothetical protein H696_02773 [Fonticula alba]KCV70431.1 hypothetical protein H696_02773 [Fonticula alba]|eukprot:XP_009494947.1 hypothetical protein H696_02773 [Fonticula alba]